MNNTEKNLKELTDQQLVKLYDEYNKRKKEIDKVLKQVRREAADRLNDRHVKRITYFDSKTEEERGFEWSERLSKTTNYELLKTLVGDKYSDVVIETTTSFVRFIKKKKGTKNIPNYTVPKGAIV
jgi:predicted transcriptional regulator